MRICSFLFIFLSGFAAFGNAFAADPEHILRSHDAPAQIIEQLLEGSGSVNSCFSAGESLMCAQGRLYPGLNTQSRQAVLKGLDLAILDSLYQFASSQTETGILKNREALTQTIKEEQDMGRIKLHGVEFASFCRGEWCGAVATIPRAGSKKELLRIYESSAFQKAYCKTLLPEALKLMKSGKIRQALLRLKEMHDLKFGDINAYLLACRAFILDGQPKDAEKIAMELLKDFFTRMNSDQAEELGDILVSLNCEPEAEQAYKLASSLLEISGS